MTTGQQQASDSFFAMWGLVQNQWNVAVIRRWQQLQAITAALQGVRL